MNNPVNCWHMLTPPDLDDETIVKLNDFLYELLDTFEEHYCYQILRYQRNLRTQQRENEFRDLFEEEDELPF
jgi:hypothetical protein